MNFTQMEARAGKEAKVVLADLAGEAQKVAVEEMAKTADALKAAQGMEDEAVRGVAAEKAGKAEWEVLAATVVGERIFRLLAPATLLGQLFLTQAAEAGASRARQGLVGHPESTELVESLARKLRRSIVPRRLPSMAIRHLTPVI